MSKRDKSEWAQDKLQVEAEKPVRSKWKDWAVVFCVGVSLGMIIGAEMARGAEFNEYGFLPEDAQICEATIISPTTIEMFEMYAALYVKLDVLGYDELTPQEQVLGYHLTVDVGCGTLAEEYRVVIEGRAGEYILFAFDPLYGFQYIIYITRQSDFRPGVEAGE